MSTHVDLPIPYDANHRPHFTQHGMIASAAMFAFFLATLIFSLCYIRRRLRLNRQNSHAGNATTIAAATTATSNDWIKCSEVIGSIPIFVYPSTPDHGEKMECAVCLMDFAEGEKGRVLPRCGHGFHSECIEMWLESHFTCPLCRVGVVESESNGHSAV